VGVVDDGDEFALSKSKAKAKVSAFLRSKTLTNYNLMICSMQNGPPSFMHVKGLSKVHTPLHILSPSIWPIWPCNNRSPPIPKDLYSDPSPIQIYRFV
jgi:hypothetical protein